jgi:hypothetical protein
MAYLFSPQAKNGFYIFKVSLGKKKEENIGQKFEFFFILAVLGFELRTLR